MIIDTIDVEKTISDISNALAEEPSISPALKKSLELLIVLVYACLARLEDDTMSNQMDKGKCKKPNIP